MTIHTSHDHEVNGPTHDAWNYAQYDPEKRKAWHPLGALNRLEKTLWIIASITAAEYGMWMLCKHVVMVFFGSQIATPMDYAAGLIVTHLLATLSVAACFVLGYLVVWQWIKWIGKGKA